MRIPYSIVAHNATICEVSRGLRVPHNIGKFSAMAAEPDADDGQSPADRERGARVRSRRKQLGLTQKQLAERVGVVEYSVSRWENGREIGDLMALARALQVRPEWLESGGETPEPGPPPKSPVQVWMGIAPEGPTVTAEERAWLESVPIPPGRELDMVPFYRQLLVAHRGLPSAQKRKAARALAFMKYLEEHSGDPEFLAHMMRFAQGKEDGDGEG
jgi:transcriptional regulator with XRE-family HTH domain